MKNKRILSGILIIIGICLYVFGSYISEEVSEGRQKIKSSQKTVNKGRKFSQFSPYTKDLGNMAADSAQKKINEGRQTANTYQVLANVLHGGGIIVFVVGIGLMIFTFLPKKRKKD